MEEGRKTDSTTAASFLGSPRWCSPEALLKNSKTLKSDIWSWGCLVLEIMTGEKPYDHIKNENNVVMQIAGGVEKRRKPEPNPLSNFPSSLLGLLWRCWEYRPESRPDVSVCACIDLSIRSQAKGVPEWDTSWLDEWIMKFIPEFETAVGECIYRARRDPNMARNLCGIASLSRAELQRDLKEMVSLLNPTRGGKRLPRATTDYLLLRKTTIQGEIRRQAKRATQTKFKRGQDPVFQILQIFAFLRGPISFTHAQVGERLWELGRLLAMVIAPLEPGNGRLASNLSAFGLLVRYYSGGLYDLELVDYVMDVYYGHHLRRGSYRLCLDVALWAAQQYRKFSEADPRPLPRLAGALDKAATCAEFLHEDETARPLLQEAIGVYRRLVDVHPKGKGVQSHEFKILLARTLVRYWHVVCRLGPELAAHWTKDALDALREAIKIYSVARAFGQSGQPKYREELEDALLDLVVMTRRSGDSEEAAEAEARLRRLREEDQD